jgi:hypothetical protein
MGLLRSALLGGLVLVSVLSVAYLGYSNLNPHVVTITQQQILTNTENLYVTQTQTSVTTESFFQTVTTSVTPGNVYVGPGNGYYQNCGYYGCYYAPPAYASINDLCPSKGQNATVSCSGYLYEPSAACTELAIPYLNPEIMETTGYLYLTLYNLPSNHPNDGAWVTVTGSVYQGYPSNPYGPVCTSNYMNVISIS